MKERLEFGISQQQTFQEWPSLLALTTMNIGEEFAVQLDFFLGLNPVESNHMKPNSFVQ